jgi:nucleotide-binding universal stress UspA family protein
MSQLHCKSVVVGVDGSKAAISAAKWAIDEAISRDLPLRLVHVIPRDTARGAQPSAWDIERGEMALGQADGAVQGVGKPVAIETALLSGDPEQILKQESQDAALVCLGVGKPDWGSGESIGPTAAALATGAHCPVAIIRSDSGEPPAEGGVIAVVLNDEPDNDDVVHHAMEEGRLRKATVRQIDRRLDSWVRRFPDVRVEVVAGGTGGKWSHSRSSAIDLAVVGQSDADGIAGIGSLNSHPILGYPDCSVLLVRH